MAFFYLGPNIINVFTDASTTKLKKQKPTSVGSGFVVMSNNEVVDQNVSVIHYTTSSFGELYALFMASNWIFSDAWTKRYQYGIEPINSILYNIFCDSLYIVNSIRSWVKLWLDQRKYKVYSGQYRVPLLVKKDKTPIEHQDCMMHIVKTLLDSNVFINLYHIRSHMNPKSNSDLKEAMSDFVKNPLIKEGEVSKELLGNIIGWNNYVDRYTRNYLYDYLHQKAIAYDEEHETINKLNWPIKWTLNPFERDHYQQLIR